MIDTFWVFVGVLTGLLVVSVFVPPNHTDNELPTPNDDTVFHTKSGCVKFKAEEVECTGDAKSLASKK
jgi:ribosomal protein L27